MRGTPALYFNSLNRPFTVLGVERQLFFLLVSVCLPVAVSARFAPLMDGVALAIFIGLHAVGIALTRVDAHMLSLYRRHIRYRTYYSPIAGLWAKPSPVKMSVPYYQGKRGGF